MECLVLGVLPEEPIVLLVESELMALSFGARMLRTARVASSDDYRTQDAQMQGGTIPRVHIRHHQPRYVSFLLAEVLELVR